MRYVIFIALLFVSWPAMAQNLNVAMASQPAKTLIRSITMEGFVLGDKGRFVKIFKPYRNKYLSTADMDDILQKIQIIYEREGYKQLVSITYQVVNKHRLVFTALMTS